MDLLTAYAKHERRVVVAFSSPVASGGFGLAPTAYVLETLDGRSADPLIQAALVVPGTANTVELALASPMAIGAAFRLTVTSVPAASGPAASGTVDFNYAALTPRRNKEQALTSERELVLYLSDLAWNGVDFQETATGDLEATEGPSNVAKALSRRVRSGPLPWDPSYGANARSFVDAPVGTAGTLRGTAAAQCALDPRIAKVDVQAIVDGSRTYLEVTPTLASGETPKKITIEVEHA